MRTVRATAAAGTVALLLAGTGVSADVASAAGTPGLAHSAVQQPSTATASLSPSVVTFGQKVVISAQLTAASGLTTAPVAGATAYLQHEAVGSTAWDHAVGTHLHHTGRSGRVQWTITPANIGSFRVHFPAGATYAKATTAALTVQVRPAISLTKLTTAPALSTTHLTGRVHPKALTGDVYLQRYRNGAWHRSDHVKVKAGKFSFPIEPSALGKLKFRVVRHHDPEHLATVTKPLKITVVHRTLTYGAVGADVLALWKRLKALHYDVGAKTKTYGWDLVHAVTAFQKVQGFHRDGDADESVWKALSHPKKPHLRHPIPGATAVEINLTKQILMIAKNGKIWRILDTSTAGGYTYTDSAGEQATAVTPTGHFTIKYKIDHLVTDKLGSLYRPSYFDYSGDAIHGEGDTDYGDNVPPYPASHGCVRITDLAVDRYYNLFVVGMSVWIYH